MLESLFSHENFLKVDGIFIENKHPQKTIGFYENQQKDIYDGRSENYKKILSHSYPDKLGYTHLLLTYREHLRWVKKLQLRPHERVLDIGCNIGDLLHLMNHQEVIDGVGLDISIEALKTAKLNSPENFEFMLTSVESGIPFKDNSFDVVTSMDVLEHLENPERVLKEVMRVLKPGGRFLFHIPVTDMTLSLDWFYQKLSPVNFDKKMKFCGHFLEIMKSDRQIKDAIRSCGLEIVEAKRFNALLQTIFDYHMTHRFLNTVFFVWNVPLKYYHRFLAYLVEAVFLYPDRLLQKMGIGSSMYYLGRKPRK